MGLYQLDYIPHEPCEDQGLDLHGRDTGVIGVVVQGKWPTDMSLG